MSIALSAIVRPSRTARRLLAGWALAQWCAAAMVLATPSHFDVSAWLAAVLAGAGAALGWVGVQPPKTHQIDISGTGELRVTVQQSVRSGRRFATAATVPDPAFSPPAPAPSVLLPGSVLWPGLIVLRLGAGHGPARVVPVWRDGVDGNTWRALTVALSVVGKPGGSDRKHREQPRDDGFERHR